MLTQSKDIDIIWTSI